MKFISLWTCMLCSISENILHQEHEQPQEDPTTGPTIDHVFEENIPHQEHEQPRAVHTSEALVQQGAESSVLRGNIEKIKTDIAQKELDIKSEKAKLRVTNESISCLSKASVVLSLLSSHRWIQIRYTFNVPLAAR
ncbi:uncharacterized protein [Primulina huaijiensis]|uniref:uncharacterized protein n=1 Tax=Primulina huaijiensis TaxID=1492673 RepID=UPI003CC797A2